MKRSLINNLRRLHSLSSFSFIQSRSIQTLNPDSITSPHSSPTTLFNNPFAFSNNLLFTRSFSVGNGGGSDGFGGGGGGGDGEVGSGEDGVTEVVSSGGGDDGNWYDMFLDTLEGVLDGYHDVTGLPWWVVISSSTLFLRLILLPVYILQLQKMKIVSKFLPRLGPPFPRPFSGKSYVKHFLSFRKKRKAIGCPSYMWALGSTVAQVPCFLLWMATIRRMALNNHAGFDSGGILWFQNLTELPHGLSASIFPVLIAGLHYINVQTSFKQSMVKEGTGPVSLLGKYYKRYLEILVLPMFLAGFYIPQGSLIYWLTNSSITFSQHLLLNNMKIRERLGLPDKTRPVKSEIVEYMGLPKAKELGLLHERKISVQNYLPKELVSLSVVYIAKGLQDKAIPLLRLALEKDPGYVNALVVMGQALMKKGLLNEATEYFVAAISKLFINGFPTEVEDIDLLIVASTWAGSTCFRQGKKQEGLEHLQRIGHMKEPEDPKSKAHYFDGLLFLGSALMQEDRNEEASEYLRLVAAYDPSHNDSLQQCLEDIKNAKNKKKLG